MEMSGHWIQSPWLGVASFIYAPHPHPQFSSPLQEHRLQELLSPQLQRESYCVHFPAMLEHTGESTPHGEARSRLHKHVNSLCEFNSLQNGPLSASVQLDQFKSPFLSCKANWYFFPQKMSSLHPSHALLHAKGFLIASRFPQACALIRYFAVTCSGLSFSRTSDWKRPLPRTSGCLSPRKWGSWLPCAVTVRLVSGCDQTENEN